MESVYFDNIQSTFNLSIDSSEYTWSRFEKGGIPTVQVEIKGKHTVMVRNRGNTNCPGKKGGIHTVKVGIGEIHTFKVEIG